MYFSPAFLLAWVMLMAAVMTPSLLMASAATPVNITRLFFSGNWHQNSVVTLTLATDADLPAKTQINLIPIDQQGTVNGIFFPLGSPDPDFRNQDLYASVLSSVADGTSCFSSTGRVYKANFSALRCRFDIELETELPKDTNLHCYFRLGSGSSTISSPISYTAQDADGNAYNILNNAGHELVQRVNDLWSAGLAATYSFGVLSATASLASPKERYPEFDTIHISVSFKSANLPAFNIFPLRLYGEPINKKRPEVSAPQPQANAYCGEDVRVIAHDGLYYLLTGRRPASAFTCKLTALYPTATFLDHFNNPLTAKIYLRIFETMYTKESDMDTEEASLGGVFVELNLRRNAPQNFKRGPVRLSNHSVDVGQTDADGTYALITHQWTIPRDPVTERRFVFEIQDKTLAPSSATNISQNITTLLTSLGPKTKLAVRIATDSEAGREQQLSGQVLIAESSFDGQTNKDALTHIYLQLKIYYDPTTTPTPTLPVFAFPIKINGAVMTWKLYPSWKPKDLPTTHIVPHDTVNNTHALFNLNLINTASGEDYALQSAATVGPRKTLLAIASSYPWVAHKNAMSCSVTSAKTAGGEDITTTATLKSVEPTIPHLLLQHEYIPADWVWVLTQTNSGVGDVLTVSCIAAVNPKEKFEADATLWVELVGEENQSAGFYVEIVTPQTDFDHTRWVQEERISLHYFALTATRDLFKTPQQIISDFLALLGQTSPNFFSAEHIRLHAMDFGFGGASRAYPDFYAQMLSWSRPAALVGSARDDLQRVMVSVEIPSSYTGDKATYFASTLFKSESWTIEYKSFTTMPRVGYYNSNWDTAKLAETAPATPIVEYAPCALHAQCTNTGDDVGLCVRGCCVGAADPAVVSVLGAHLAANADNTPLWLSTSNAALSPQSVTSVFFFIAAAVVIAMF